MELEIRNSPRFGFDRVASYISDWIITHGRCAPWHVPAAQQREEIGLAVLVGSNQLAIDEAGSHRQRQDCRGDCRKSAAEIAAILAKGRGSAPNGRNEAAAG
jgi:hypothetical protein